MHIIITYYILCILYTKYITITNVKKIYILYYIIYIYIYIHTRILISHIKTQCKVWVSNNYAHNFRVRYLHSPVAEFLPAPMFFGNVFTTSRNAPVPGLFPPFNCGTLHLYYLQRFHGDGLKLAGLIKIMPFHKFRQKALMKKRLQTIGNSQKGSYRKLPKRILRKLRKTYTVDS